MEKICEESTQSLTGTKCWRFCSGGENPTDIPSRSCRARELVHNELWWKGPEFLKESSAVWPIMPTRHDPSEAHE